MSTHEPSGTTLCVHSVVVAPQYRRRGIAAWMMRSYVRQVARRCPHIARIHLLAHADRCRLYEQAGFRSLGVSAVAWGSQQWTEMQRCGALSCSDCVGGSAQSLLQTYHTR
jgi:N-acetylglutamate synthase-like GNAT family acetyltransferase